MIYKGEPYEPEEVAFLFANFNSMTYPELAKKLKRTDRGVRKIAGLLGLAKNNTSKRTKTVNMLSEQEILDRCRRAKKFAEMRRMAGIKQQVLAAEFKICSSNVSHMESGGYPISDERFNYMKQLFESWRVAEIARLSSKLTELKTFTV